MTDLTDTQSAVLRALRRGCRDMPMTSREVGESPSPDGFLPWLVKEGYVEDIDSVIAWHVGRYSDFEP